MVSSEGHDQFVDVLTGEREEDQIAAGYYRQVTQQDPNHTFPADTLVFPVEDSDGWNVDDTEIEPDYHVSSVWLAGWVDDGGWADSDEVWLGVEWAYSLDKYGDHSSRIAESASTLQVEVDGETQEHELYFDGGHSASSEAVSYFPVPIDTIEVDILFDVDVTVDSRRNAHVFTEGDNQSFTTDTLEVSFPDEAFGSDEEEVEEAEDEDESEVQE